MVETSSTHPTPTIQPTLVTAGATTCLARPFPALILMLAGKCHLARQGAAAAYTPVAFTK